MRCGHKLDVNDPENVYENKAAKANRSMCENERLKVFHIYIPVMSFDFEHLQADFVYVWNRIQVIYEFKIC